MTSHMPTRDNRDRDPKLLMKVLLTRLGSVLGARAIYELNGCFNYMYAGWWLRTHGLTPDKIVRSRFDLFDLIGREVADQVVLYLEFGVAGGASMRYWSRLLRHPDASLHGFDSFQGLPHDWSLEGHPRGYFSTAGAVPEIDDPRVEFFPGLFEETLHRYASPEHEVLVAVLDADLYTSTATALSFLRGNLRPGSYLYFDQFHHRCDELRAFNEFLDENPRQLRLVGMTREITSVAFQVLG
jgi:Macrocin-O-methyltransferase (TylF)